MNFKNYSAIAELVKLASGKTDGTTTAAVTSASSDTARILVGPAAIEVSPDFPVAVGDILTFDVGTGVVTGQEKSTATAAPASEAAKDAAPKPARGKSAPTASFNKF